MFYENADDPHLLADLRAALQRWHKATMGDAPLAARLAEVERRLAADPGLARADVLRGVIRAALDHLRTNGQADHADLLERRYLRQQGVYRLCEDYHFSERSLYYRLQEATAALAHALWAVEQQGLTGFPKPVRSVHLPPPDYTRLFGVEGLLARLLARLEAPDDHWLVSLEGMGGLGKTALAREAAGRLAETGRFASVAWETAKQEFYTWHRLETSPRPALTFEQLLDAIADQLGGEGPGPLPLAAKRERVRALLRDRPCLVVVDNLETAVDAETLPGQLWELARPSKFLFTSRYRLPPCPGLSALPVDELAEPDALALLRYEGQQRGLLEVAQADNEALRPILAVTGGNPLALKLVVGQLVSLPLSRVLAELKTVQPETDPFYQYLYRRSWDLLSAPARHLLLCMTLLPAGGGEWEDLAALTGLSDKDLTTAITGLIAHSLLQAGGLEKAYTIHPLTHSFIANQAMKQAGFAANILRAGEYYLTYARRHADDWAALGRRRDHLLQAMQLCAGLGPEGQRIVIEGGRLLNSYMVRHGYLATWLPYLDLALQAAADLGDEAAQADLWNCMGVLRGSQGDLDAALALHRRAAEAFRRLGDDLNLARSLRWQGNVHYARPDRPAALACYQQARDLLVPLDELLELSRVYNNLANVYFNEGNWAQALACYEQALALLDPERGRQHVTTLLDNIGLLRWEMGFWRQAVADLMRALPLQQAAGDRVGQANTHHYLCLAYADLEEWEQALAHGRRALVLRQELGLAEGLADLYTDLATLYLRLGDEQEARSYLKLAEPLWHQAERPGGVARIRLIQGELAGRAEAWPQAQAAYEGALALLGPGSDPAWRLTALLGQAEARFQTGDGSAAQALLSRAEALAVELGRPDLQVRVLWLQAGLNPTAAGPILEKALALCCSADRDNDRLNRLGRETRARLRALNTVEKE